MTWPVLTHRLNDLRDVGQLQPLLGVLAAERDGGNAIGADAANHTHATAVGQCHCNALVQPPVWAIADA